MGLLYSSSADVGKEWSTGVVRRPRRAISGSVFLPMCLLQSLLGSFHHCLDKPVALGEGGLAMTFNAQNHTSRQTL